MTERRGQKDSQIAFKKCVTEGFRPWSAKSPLHQELTAEEKENLTGRSPSRKERQKDAVQCPFTGDARGNCVAARQKRGCIKQREKREFSVRGAGNRVRYRKRLEEKVRRVCGPRKRRKEK